MEKSVFQEMLSNNNAIPLDNDYVIFKDLELYNFKTKEQVFFRNIDDLFASEFNGTTFAEYIAGKDKFIINLDGGRGADSGAMGGGFSHAPNGGGNKKNGRAKYPAEFNVGGRFQDYGSTLKLFRQKYANMNHEFGIAVSADGFVTRHIEGGSTSVSISGNVGEMIIHNHPGSGERDGGNFSDSDLLSISYGGEKGIVAVSQKYTHTFTKEKNFDAKRFIKAVKNAKWPVRYDYDDGADWWLRRNAKVYGYSYTRRAA